MNRTLQHNAQAAGYGVSGLLNIHWRTRSVEPQAAASVGWAWNPALTSDAFWADWAATSFGPSAGPAAAAIFSTSLDSYAMPRPVSWVGGPGAWVPDLSACPLVGPDNSTYAFVDALAALRPLVVADLTSGKADASHLERFDYWLTSLRYTRGIARTTCAWGQYQSVFKQISSMPAGPARQAAARSTGYTAFQYLVGNATVAQWDLLSSVTTPGELGTVVNTQSHSLLPNAVGPAVQASLSSLAGEPLPSYLIPTSSWDPSRVPLLRVPVVRGVLQKGEELRLTALLVAHPSFTPAQSVTLYVAPLYVTPPQWTSYAMTQAVPAGGVPRQLFSATIAGGQLDPEGVQWYIEAVLPGNATAFNGPSALLPSPGASFDQQPGAIVLRFPPTAPQRPQSVVIV